MTLNSSGPISFGGSTTGQSINLELGVSATALASINSTSFRTLAGVASGQISLSNFYGKSNANNWIATSPFGSAYPTGTLIRGSYVYVFSRNSATALSYNSYAAKLALDASSSPLTSVVCSTTYTYGLGNTYSTKSADTDGTYVYSTLTNYSNDLSSNVGFTKFSIVSSGSGFVARATVSTAFDVLNTIYNPSDGIVYTIGAFNTGAYCCARSPAVYAQDTSGTFNWFGRLTAGSSPYMYDACVLSNSRVIGSDLNAYMYKIYNSNAVFWSFNSVAKATSINRSKYNPLYTIIGGFNGNSYVTWGYFDLSTTSSNTSTIASGAISLVASGGPQSTFGKVNATDDASGNVYLIAQLSATALLITKFNSSNVVQWIRRITLGTNYSFYPNKLNIDCNGTNLVISFSIYYSSTLTNNTVFVFNLPADGSKTNTYTVTAYAGSTTITYATDSTYTQITGSLNNGIGLTYGASGYLSVSNGSTTGIGTTVSGQGTQTFTSI